MQAGSDTSAARLDGTGPVLSLKGVSKSFGRVKVLHEISMDVHPGEIVALVGDNGAGKSTLIKVMTGVHEPTTGEVVFKGEIRRDHSVKWSRAKGLETVYQERALADQQPLWRNMFAGRELIGPFGMLRIAEQRAACEKLLREHIGFTSSAINVDSEVKSLSGGEKQGVAIARALFFDADLIILDEPTMGLSLKETKKVLDFVKDIRARGKSAILIDHNIFHVHEVADRFVILDRGRIAGSYRKEELTQDGLIRKMLNLATKGRLED